MKNIHYNNSNLALAISKGDHLAFKELYIQYFEDLFIYANRILGEIDESKDAVQVVITKLREKKDSLSEVKDLKAYLYR